MEPLTKARATVDLDALARNYRLLAERGGGRPPAGIVKADGYGVGAVAVACRLLDEGCERFFVARLDEGLALRSALRSVLPPGPGPEILVLDGATPGADDELVAADLTPVLNDLGQVERWRAAAASAGRTLPAALHVDTGMTRLGLPTAEADRLAAEPSRLNGLAVGIVMSHLASADEPGSPQPAAQLERFRRLRSRFPQGLASLANSAGTFLGPEYRFDLIRPGISLYGGAPLPGRGRNPMEPVVTIEVPVLQVQEAEPGTEVGYGATHRVERPTRLATIAVGYADGFPRAARHRHGLGRGVTIGGHSAPIVGRISMDLVVVDVGHLLADTVVAGTPVELLGPHQLLDDVATAAGTIANEILTSIGSRYERVYATVDADPAGRRPAQGAVGRR